MLFNRRHFSITAASAFASACAAQSAVPSFAEQDAQASIGQAYEKIFPVGAAVTPGQIIFSASDFIKKQFRILVAENVMKPGLIAKRAEGRYEFEPADEIVNFGIANGMKVRGHTLVWHEQMPSWFFTDSGKTVTREVLLARMEKYITDVMGHFKGRVFAWDVVNEAFVYNEADKETDENGMRMSPFRRIIGPDYIEHAFKMAAKADPQAQLFYNDYETQTPAKLDSIVRLVKQFKAKGIKIDGVGHQAHCTVHHPSVNAMEYAIDEIAKLGVTQHITELDIALNGNLMESKVTSATPELLQLQAQRYSELFDLFARKRESISAVLMWGLNDSQSWLRLWPRPRFEAPMLFDEAYKPKPAFWRTLAVAKKYS